MAGRNDPSWPPSYIPRLGTVRALRTYQWSETPMARWARGGLVHQFARVPATDTPRCRRADPSLSGQKKEPGSAPSPNAPARHPIGKICGTEQKPPAGGSGVPALRRRRRPATTACESDGGAAGSPASEISRDSGACMHRARFWRPGAAGSRVEY